ncbi:MAG TPA: inositol monophosphatase family protein [Sandaracinaceae bacterium LLY-WYZ-13_1]|nr:inositol monophosphatase family protein [Sandaracinaceae bacterium LLY-WYZ-13_1]
MADAFDLGRIGGHRAFAELLDEVLAAGEHALRLYRQGAANRMSKKPDRSPVTEADEAVEERLLKYLRKRYPDAGFLGEETGRSGPSEAGLRWVVDPIDGTRAFIRGIPTWSILVGLERDGVPVLGVAYMPAAEDLFVGIAGEGARANGRPVHVSQVEHLADATITHGALSQFTDLQLGHLLPRLGQQTYTQRGFADFDGYRQLVLGRVDAMIDPGVAPWDICAAAVIVREAGGRLTSLAGEDTIHGGGAVASNAAIHDALVALLAAEDA